MLCTDENVPASTLGKSLAVVVLLLIAAAVLSYLWAYALNDALVAGHFAMSLNSDNDPRPGQMETAFAVILSVLFLTAGLLKWTSSRQIRRIDAMNGE